MRAGFSLVEVVLALGIVSVAFIPLMGLLPTGLSAMWGAMDETLASQIIQEIGNEIQQSDFDAVSSSASLRYYDDGMRELPAALKAESVYQSRVAVMVSTEAPYLKRLVIQVARNPGVSAVMKEKELADGTSVWVTTNTLPMVTRSLLLARSSSITN